MFVGEKFEDTHFNGYWYCPYKTYFYCKLICGRLQPKHCLLPHPAHTNEDHAHKQHTLGRPHPPSATPICSPFHAAQLVVIVSSADGIERVVHDSHTQVLPFHSHGGDVAPPIHTWVISMGKEAERNRRKVDHQINTPFESLKNVEVDSTGKLIDWNQSESLHYPTK